VACRRELSLKFVHVGDFTLIAWRSFQALIFNALPESLLRYAAQYFFQNLIAFRYFVLFIDKFVVDI
jgi:hypothetical protein